LYCVRLAAGMFSRAEMTSVYGHLCPAEHAGSKTYAIQATAERC